MRNKVIAAVLLLSVAAPVLAASAESERGEAQPARWETTFGIEIYRFEYEESFMEEEGLFLGFKASSFRNLGASRVFLGGDFRFAGGEVDYDGQTQAGEPLRISSITDVALEMRGVLGITASESEDQALRLYAGLGYRYLLDDLSMFWGGYLRESNYLYSPLGVDYAAELSQNWSFGASLEYDFFWRGLQRSYLSDLSWFLPDAKNDQKDGYGIRGAVRFVMRQKFFIEAFARYWDIDESELDYAGGMWIVEPANETTEVGILVGVGF